MQAQPWPRTTGFAVSGMVFAFVFPPLGMLLSFVALVQIGNSRGRLRGKGYAIAGLVISFFMLFSWMTMSA